MICSVNHFSGLTDRQTFLQSRYINSIFFDDGHIGKSSVLGAMQAGATYLQLNTEVG